jgi:glycine cleavage system H lipoate-binding protein
MIYLLWGLAALLLIGLLTGLSERLFRVGKEGVRKAAAAVEAIFDEKSVRAPKGLYYDKTHTWAFMDQDGMVTAGIDDFLMHVTGPATRVEMKDPGDKIKKGDPFLTIIQQGKKLVVYSPVSGTIRSGNRDVIAQPSLLHTDPCREGWVYRIEPANWSRETEFMSMAEKYRTWLNGEFTRLKDFLASRFGAANPQYAHVVLQDGGALKDSLLEELGPEVWEDFQNRFLDPAR